MLSSGVPWFGGKHKARKHILPFIGRTAHTLYCELFAGGASVFFGKETSKKEVLNELNHELTTYYRVLRRHPAAILDELAEMLIGREPFYELKHTKPEHLTDIQQAARFLVLQQLCYAGKPHGRYFSPRQSKVWSMARREYEQLIASTSARIRHAVIENEPWEKCLAHYDGPRTLFYADPPYIEVSAAYGIPFTKDDQQRLAEALKTIRGRFIVSLNDHPLARDLYRGCRFKRIRCHYVTTARVGKMKLHDELLILGPPGREPGRHKKPKGRHN